MATRANPPREDDSNYTQPVVTAGPQTFTATAFARDSDVAQALARNRARAEAVQTFGEGTTNFVGRDEARVKIEGNGPPFEYTATYSTTAVQQRVTTPPVSQPQSNSATPYTGPSQGAEAQTVANPVAPPVSAAPPPPPPAPAPAPAPVEAPAPPPPPAPAPATTVAAQEFVAEQPPTPPPNPAPAPIVQQAPEQVVLAPIRNEPVVGVDVTQPAAAPPPPAATGPQPVAESFPVAPQPQIISTPLPVNAPASPPVIVQTQATVDNEPRPNADLRPDSNAPRVSAPAQVGATAPATSSPTQVGAGAIAPNPSAQGLSRPLENTRTQATQQDQANFTAQEDWRVRLSLAPSANYLYKAKEPGILKPLADTNGVIFPYTPYISVSYAATYDPTDLIHANYKVYQYKNSSVDNIQITCDFTAQDTLEANYLLAVIHFFKSVTKMFYGQDQNPKRGTPPPICFLTGLGAFQFNEHPLAITNFNYNLPTDVDYIRAGQITSLAGVNQNAVLRPMNNYDLREYRLTNIKPGGSPIDTEFGRTNLETTLTYVPTKMQIQVTAVPMMSRNDVSNNFSLSDYATGKLTRGIQNVRGGFW
jgi:hypothetical protein